MAAYRRKAPRRTPIPSPNAREMKFKRVTFAAPGEVVLETVETELEIDSPTEVIVRNHFSLVSAGTELACMSGREPWFPLPGTPGYAAVGEVIEKGDGVTKLSRG